MFTVTIRNELEWDDLEYSFYQSCFFVAMYVGMMASGLIMPIYRCFRPKHSLVLVKVTCITAYLLFSVGHPICIIIAQFMIGVMYPTYRSIAITLGEETLVKSDKTR